MTYTANNPPIKFATAPLMVAAWPGLGNVGLMAVDYLRRKLDAEPIQTVDMSQFFVPMAAPVKQGRVQPFEVPQGGFHMKRSPDLLLFESTAQVNGKEGIFFLGNLLEQIRKFGVTRMYTVAAYPQAMSFTDESELFYATNSESMASTLRIHGIRPLPDGEIAGPAGLVPNMASVAGLEAACILATIPLYAAGFSYPKAALRILTLLQAIGGFTVDLDEAKVAVASMESQFSRIEEQMRSQFPALFSRGGDSDDAPLLPEPSAGDNVSAPEEPAIPLEDMARIEVLFAEAKHDRAKALELKGELDRLGIYRELENRFLDLFSNPLP